MKKSLTRLLVLRERLKGVAEMELNSTAAAIASTESHLDQGTGGTSVGVSCAADLQDVAYRRELAVGHLKSLNEQLVQRQEVLAVAKREERQVELLVQKRAKEAALKQSRIEAATLDDWFRSTTWEEK